MTQLHDHLTSINACPPALDWIGDRTAQQAWDECEQADWLLWWLFKEHLYGSDGYCDAVRATADCAETAVQYLKTEKQRSVVTAALAVTRAWADEPSEHNRIVARRAAANVYAYAYVDYAANAVAATAAAAYTNANAYTVAYVVADAAATATAAYVAAAYAATRRTTYLKMCSLIRTRIPLAPWKETENG